MAANKPSNFSDLIQRVTANCLLNPLGPATRFPLTPDRTTVAAAVAAAEEAEPSDSSDGEDRSEVYEETTEINGYEEYDGKCWEEGENQTGKTKQTTHPMAAGPVAEMAVLMGKVFEAVAEMKRAYKGMQDAHCPWDAEKMRVADVAVVAELRRLGVLRERFRRGFGPRSCITPSNRDHMTSTGLLGATVKEVVAPYEAMVEELKREVKVKETEVENLRERLTSLAATGLAGKKGGGRSMSKKRNVSFSLGQAPVLPSSELFEHTMTVVKETSKSFTGGLLSLMRASHWDISAAIRSISSTITTATTANPRHGKYALESYISRKLFMGFEHETFYLDGTLSSLLEPQQFRRHCYSQYRDMKSMEPSELLGVTPTCQFGVFCSKKYLSVVHPKMEESLFGDLEQRRLVLGGSHPRTQFYREFLRVAKAVWLLHLLAFSLDPAPSHFEASRGAEFHPSYMESVVRYPGGKVPSGQVVGFSVSPGFKLGNGSVIRARVYLVSKN